MSRIQGLLLVLLLTSDAMSQEYRFTVRVTTPLTYRNTPFDPEIDFEKLLRNKGVSKTLDPNSWCLFSLF